MSGDFLAIFTVVLQSVRAENRGGLLDLQRGRAGDKPRSRGYVELNLSLNTELTCV